MVPVEGSNRRFRGARLGVFALALLPNLLRAQTGLVAAYGFNEASGTTVSDASGKGHTGTIQSAVWTASGKFGAALSFNGSSALVSIADAADLHLTSQMTLEAWVNPSAVTAVWRDVIYKALDNYFLEATSDRGSPGGGGTFGSTTVVTYGAATLTANTWAHLALTYDGAAIRLYVNGAQVSTLARTGNLLTSTSPLQIGGDSVFGQYFRGLIDEVRIYNIALTQAQIQADMNTPIGATAPDTQPPTQPANLTATAASPSQINLTWTASTDNIAVTGYALERCQGAGCTNFASLATTAGTVFNDTGLASNTTYTYHVLARDAAGNSSPFSLPASATTPAPDTQAPTQPANLTATAVNPSQINLSWTASTDNVGVTGYQLQRCQGANCTNFAQVAAPAGTTFNDTGLAAGTTYTYRVLAADAAGNVSLPSIPAGATTPALTSGLVAAYSFNEGVGAAVADASGNGNTGTIVNAVWTTSGKYGSALQFNGTTALVTVPDSVALHLTSAMTLEAWVNPSVVNSTWRDVIYKATDNYFLEATSTSGSAPAGGITSGTSTTATFGAASLTGNTWTHLALTYDGATLRLYVNGVQAAATSKTGPAVTSTSPLQIGGDSVFGQYFAGILDEIRIYNVVLTAAQIQADMAAPIGPTGPDTQPPTAPGNLTATAVNSAQINLSWAASTDNVGVTGYQLARCQGVNCTNFAQVATPAGTTFSDTGLTASTSYSYQVRATDAAGNLSQYSNVSSATTLVLDTQPPTQPANLTATAVGGTQINLSWSASTDDVGVTGYLIERCQGVNCSNFARLQTVTTTTYSDTGLLPNTSYTYHVRASDAAGNMSPYSNTASATTLSTIPGLVSAYSFNEGAGTTAGDSSGNGNKGTLTSGITWTSSGKFGNALLFSGTNAFVSVPDSASLHLSTAMTLEAWVNPSVVNASWRDVIYKAADNYFLEATSDNNSTPAGGGTLGGTTTETYGTAALAVNTWTHLAVTYDGSALRLYVNGVQVSSSPKTGAITTSANALQIGGDSVFGQYFTGMIDEVRVYNIALTAAQIQADMTTPVPNAGSFPNISLNPTSISFGNQAQGTSSTPQQVTVTNSGTAPLTFSGITISGSNPGDFSQTSTCTSALAPGGACTITVTFTPAATGTRSGAISISDNAPLSPQTVALTGTGTGFSITPHVTALTPTRTQQFTAINGSGAITWSVDGIAGGSASLGTITSAGLYTPPAATGTHTVTATTTSSQSASATVYVTNYAGVFTFHYDNSRTGQNLNETVLTPANVNSAQFGKLFAYALDGFSYASPVYVANVNIPGQGFRNVVYVATEHDSVYAFDADTGGGSPLWKTSFLGSGVTTVPSSDTGECCDIANEIGITGTPVIDQATGTLYVVAKTKESGSYVQRLHALDIATGAEKFGGPVVLQASVPGTGDGSSGGKVAFNALRQNQRPGLLLSNGVVYIAFASHGDNPPWHGWVLGYNASTLQQTMAFNATPNAYGGGIWQSGGGVSTDATGNLYFATANGAFDADGGGKDYGDTIAKLSPAGAVVDYFTPHDQAIMEANNYDLSSSGPVLLIDQPGAHPHLLVAAAKTGTIYVIDRDNMGHYNPGSDSQIVQSLVNAMPNGTEETGNYSAPVFYNSQVYFCAVNDVIRAFQFNNGLLSTAPTSQSFVTYPNRGGSFSISANGSTNGILWAVQDNSPSPGVLRAYNPANLAIELYNSDQAGTRDSLGLAAKFNIPTVANGKVFVVTQNQLVVYGLLP